MRRQSVADDKGVVFMYDLNMNLDWQLSQEQDMAAPMRQGPCPMAHGDGGGRVLFCALLL